MNNRDKDLDLDMEKGGAEVIPEGPTKTTVPYRKAGLTWKVAAAILMAGLVVFAVAFPLVRNRDDDNKATSVSDNTDKVPNNAPVASESGTYTSSNGAFNVTLNLFTKDMVNGYSDTETLEKDLSNAAMFLLNGVIKRNIEQPQYNGGISSNAPSMEVNGDPDLSMEGAPVADAPSDAGSGSDKLNDFGQNNQENDVEEGDMMVSNGEIVFAAYGDEIVAWSAADGTLLKRIQMPPVEVEDMSGIPETTTSSAKTSVMPGTYSYKPTVRHLLIDDGRLMVIVEGYGQMFRDEMVKAQGEMPVLYDYKATNIQLYDIVAPEDGYLQLSSETHVNGRFMSVRSINGNVHVVTHAGIDSYTSLVAPYEIYNHPDLTPDDYVAMVKKDAGDAIPQFVSRLMTELKAPTGTMPNLFRLAMMQSDVSESDLEAQVFSDGVVNSVALVYSFNMLADNSLGELKASSSGSFLDSWYIRVYSSDTTMILAGDGWEYDETSDTSTQSTHLLGISLNGATSTPGSIGTVEGYFLNPHSLDVDGNVLRIATTIQNSWNILPIDPVILESESSGGARRLQTDDESRTENYIINLDLAAPDGEMKELGRVKLGKPNEVFTSVRFFDNIAYAVTFEQKDPLYVLDLEDAANPVILSELNVTGFSSYLHSLNPPLNTLLLGMGQEADEDGQIVGFQISIFDLADSDNPKLVQRHVVENDETTYSSSLSEWDFMATRIVDGRLIIPLDIDNWEDQTKSFHGFAVFVVNENEITEDCRIAHEMQSMMYLADAVEPAASDSVVGDVMPGMCFCGNDLPRRSMIFNGDLMTTQGSVIKSTDMGTCIKVWELDVSDEEQDTNCCGYAV